MKRKVLCVLRSGGPYDAEDVFQLKAQVMRHLPGADFWCLSDVPVHDVKVMPLLTKWPGWWAKMEMFRPGLVGDFLYLDLDTVVVGDLRDIWSVGGLAIMRDVYRQGGLQSSIMFLPEDERGRVWDRFTENPERYMRRHKAGGDQEFLEELWWARATRFQDAVPGQIVSFKADVQRLGKVPDGARAVVYHGQPKPRETGWRVVV